jgi:membrane-associated PAP2 superfamily phosphatase
VWLAGAAATGLVLGVAQQMRGAHFMSHTLWTGWLCWTTGWLTDPLLSGGGDRAWTGAFR